MLVLLSWKRFNTSHVTLYQRQMRVSQFFSVFQYISCYSLSTHCLSACLRARCFNTSHVTLYHSSYSGRYSERIVSIHLMLLFIEKSGLWYVPPRIVSIHLMLLFIADNAEKLADATKFQYISCYSLSDSSR